MENQRRKLSFLFEQTDDSIIQRYFFVTVSVILKAKDQKNGPKPPST